MAKRIWQVQRVCFCEHAGREIALENEVVYPSDYLSDQPPRILARRCSNAIECNMFDKPVCIFSGTNPDYEPD